MYFIGIDIGSTNAKIAVVDENKNILKTYEVSTGISSLDSSNYLFDLIEKDGINLIDSLFSEVNPIPIKEALNIAKEVIPIYEEIKPLTKKMKNAFSFIKDININKSSNDNIKNTTIFLLIFPPPLYSNKYNGL